MDQKGSLVDTNLRIFPSENLKKFLNDIPITDETPSNIVKFVQADSKKSELKHKFVQVKEVFLNDNDIKNINKIKETINHHNESKKTALNESQDVTETIEEKEILKDTIIKSTALEKRKFSADHNTENDLFLNTTDLDWIYAYIKKKRDIGQEDIPYLHVLFEGSQVELPENDIIKRNPVLEARCVKLRAQQEVREYRKMTKSVDNVRMRYPEDSISYQMKQLNKQLIAIGQFIISIFAGFLFGFRGVELMIGNLDFGFRLLLGVMCALVIALAEIYFLAKKLNEELNVPETIQLGGPPKFVNEPYFGYKNAAIDKKEHQD